LHRFPFDTIKIDRSFVNRMMHERESLGIVETITALAEKLGKTVVAEGIEKKEHQTMLNKIGCQLGQGYLFSKPLDSSSAEELLKTDCAPKTFTTGELPIKFNVEIAVGEAVYEM
jgi:EAL domain-containing protein (putative c-di-GMP-specific phosphodiesterase class I)